MFAKEGRDIKDQCLMGSLEIYRETLARLSLSPEREW